MTLARETYIRVSKADLIAALSGRAALAEADAARFADVCKLIAALIHYESFDGLERLKAVYAPLDPDNQAPGPADRARFLDAFEEVLARSSFVESPAEAVFDTAARDTLNDVRIRMNHDGIASIRFFLRGGAREEVAARRLWGLVKRSVATEVYDDVVVIVTLKDVAALDKKEAKAFSRLRRGARPGAILIKHFSDVPRVDLPSLHPGATPTMKRSDQVVLGVPAIAGGAPLLLQLANALPVIFAVIAAYFGVKGAITKDALQRALAALSGIVALAAFLMRQRLKFDRQRLVYQRRLSTIARFYLKCKIVRTRDFCDINPLNGFKINSH